MASPSAEELALVEQTIESGSVAVAELGADSGRHREVYRWVRYQDENPNWHQALVVRVEAGECQSMVSMQEEGLRISPHLIQPFDLHFPQQISAECFSTHDRSRPIAF